MSPRYKAIIKAAAEAHGLTLAQIRSSSRARPVAWARFEAMFRLREIGLSYPQIAPLLCLKDHTTVIHGCARWPEIAPSIGRPIYSEAEAERRFHLDQANRLTLEASGHLRRVVQIDRTLSGLEAA